VLIFQVSSGIKLHSHTTMPSKKKKKQDFQKVKLKVGRKLPRPANETRTQFKVRGINIRSQFQSEHSAVEADNAEPSASNIKVSSTVYLYQHLLDVSFLLSTVT